MKIYSKIITVLSLALLCNANLLAQISEGGIPPSFEYSEQNGLRSSISIQKTAPTQSVAELIYEDSKIPREGYPLRIAAYAPLSIDIDKNGTWTTLSNGQKIWRQTISAPEAVGIIMSYDALYIPEGAKLFLYNKTKEQLLGAYTHNTNPKLTEFSTEATDGDEVTLEYVASQISNESPILRISSLGYIYSSESLIELRGQSLPCMIDINCPDGANWQNQKRGVMRVLIPIEQGGKTDWYTCTGSLVNNTAQNKEPYILTAYHCFHIDDQIGNYNKSQYVFNFERVACGDADLATSRTFTGADLLVETPINKGGDGTLLKLKNTIPDDVAPYYNGWNRLNVASTSGVVIHHPNGDVKKISTYTKTVTPAGKIGFEGGDVTDANSHWRVVYSNGVTEGGSSGSPLFNSNGLIVGTLSGGSSVCANLAAGDYYARMSYHWDQYADASQHMAQYLDPLGKGVTSLEGLNYNQDVSVNDEQMIDIIVFPSPFSSEININASSIIRELNIVDLNGVIVFSISNHDSSTLAINTSNWNNGVYSVVAKTEEGAVTKKIIKQ